MDTSLERIRAKIAELGAKLADLRIAERELQALEKRPARKTRTAPGPKPKRKPEASDQAKSRQTIGAAIADVLGRHGALSAAEIADRIKAAGRDISNRAVSFSLQALKRRGLIKRRTAGGRCRRPALGELAHNETPNGLRAVATHRRTVETPPADRRQKALQRELGTEERPDAFA